MFTQTMWKPDFSLSLYIRRIDRQSLGKEYNLGKWDNGGLKQAGFYWGKWLVSGLEQEEKFAHEPDLRGEWAGDNRRRILTGKMAG